jgi:hypothetical protein
MVLMSVPAASRCVAKECRRAIADRRIAGGIAIRLCAVLVSALFVVAGVACAQRNDMILELKDVQNFHVEQSSFAPTTIKLSGLAFHNSLAFSKITTTQHDKDLQVLAHLAPAANGLSGSFDYALAVSPSIDTVTFGKTRVLIWSRNSERTK